MELICKQNAGLNLSHGGSSVIMALVFNYVIGMNLLSSWQSP